MKIKELGQSVDEQIESVFIDKTVYFGENDDADYQSLNQDQILLKLTQILDTKGEIDTEAPKTVDNLKALE